MKRAKKIMLIIAAALIVIGAAMFALSNTAAGYNYVGTIFSTDIFGYEETEYKKKDIIDDFDRVEIDCVNPEVRIYDNGIGFDGGYDNCYVELPELDEDDYTIEVRDGVLTVKQKPASLKWYERLGIGDGRYHVVTVILPNGKALSADIKNSSGRVSVGGRFTDLCIETVSGEILYGADVTGRVELKSASGDISADGEFYKKRTAPESLTVESTSGDIKIGTFGKEGDGTEIAVSSVSGDILIEETNAGGTAVATVSGDISLTGCRTGEIAVSSTSGDIRLADVIASGSLNAATVSGDVAIVDSDADSLKIDTKSGDVSGSLLSPKLFKAETKSGDIRIPDSGGGKKCEISTVSGDVKIGVKD